MTKSEWLWVARYLLIIGGAFAAGYSVQGWLNQRPEVGVTVTDPAKCADLGMKATGWEFQAKYRGGIANGGASSFITYECR